MYIGNNPLRMILVHFLVKYLERSLARLADFTLRTICESFYIAPK